MGAIENRELCCVAQIFGGGIVFYDRYVKLCEKKGVSPSAAAVEAGISKSLVTKWKTNNVKIPSPDVIKKLAAYFDIPVSELVDEEKEKTTTSKSGGFSEKDVRLMEWFRALPEEKRKAILSLGGAPEDLIE